MKFWKKGILFYLGGMTYTALEICWRGWSHGSMFVLGGLCFLLLGSLGRSSMPLMLKAVTGAVVVTALELGCGLVVNRSYQVWDYRRMPWNFHGQICLSYSALWVLLSLAAFLLYDKLDRGLHRVSARRNSSCR